MEYYSAIKSGILTFATTWVHFEVLMLSEISQTKRDKYYLILLKHGIFFKHTKNQVHRMDWWLPEARVGWAKWFRRVKRYKLPVIKLLVMGM